MGLFVVLEGSDAVGKNSQAERLRLRFERMGREVLPLSFPRYKTELGEAIRKHLVSDICVANGTAIALNPDEAATRVQNADGSFSHVPLRLAARRAPEDALVFQCMMVVDKYDAAPTIEESLMRGAVVVADRWWQSAYCYGAADGLPKEWLLRAHQRLPQAHLNIWIDVPIEETHRRRPKARDRYEEDRAKQETVREHYKALWGNDDDPYGTAPAGRWVTIDGMPDKDAVHEAIWAEVLTTLKR